MNFIKDYSSMMSKRIKEATKEDHIIHGFMVYECSKCKSLYVMWLEKGLEDPEDYAKTGKHKPVPFTFECVYCMGEVHHAYWAMGRDSLGKNYRSYNDYANKTMFKPVYLNFFWNDPNSDCGNPVIFEPDYFKPPMHMLERYLAEIFLCTLPDEEYNMLCDTFKQAVSYELTTIDLLDVLGAYIRLPVNNKSTIIETIDVNEPEDFPINRQSKRHPNGDSGYKRPRKNKKLYEY